MAISVQLPIAEYLEKSYRPDCEYIDGEIVERNLGTWEHGRVQGLLFLWFYSHEQEWEIGVSQQWRARVSHSRPHSRPHSRLGRPPASRPPYPTPPGH